MQVNSLNGDKIKEYCEIKAEVFGEVTSTNDLAKEAIKAGLNENTVFVAESQTNGRGRFGRSFFSPKGNIYMSIAFCDGEEKCYTVAAVVAVKRCIEKLFNLYPKIKWVNDLFWNGKKVCGILCETVYIPNEEAGRIIGIGLNLSGKFDGELSEIAGSLMLDVEKVDRNLFIAEVVKEFFKSAKDIDETIKEYKKDCFTIGKKVSFEYDGKLMTGIAEDISSDGSLLIKCDDENELIKLFYGEASLLK